jgi:hypothetical protein
MTEAEMPERTAGLSARKTRKRKTITLAEYVRWRNGVPLGARGSLRNMLLRSLGAGSFAEFWRYWNPIWGYALGRYVYAPLQRFLPVTLALVLTFTFLGAVHDLATTLARRAPAFRFTPWFFVMSIVVSIGKVLGVDYTTRTFGFRVLVNLTYVIGYRLLTLALMHVT